VASSSPAHFTALGGKVYFSASDGISGRELWVTDGTAAGTALVYDFNPGGGQGLTTAAAYAAINVVNGKLLVAATTPSQGAEWWVSDGTAAGTSIVKDVYPGASSGIVGQSANYNCVAGSKLYWYGSDGVLGSEVWFTDGTAAGTGVIDINPGSTGSIPFPFYGWNGKCYVQASDGVSGYECWVTDGTVAGTFLLKDIYPGSSSSSAARFSAAGDRLFFYASDATGGTGTGGELWVSDGTSAGTAPRQGHQPRDRDRPDRRVDLRARGRAPRALRSDRRRDRLEYYVSDGTAAGTKQMVDLWAGASSGASTSTGFALANGYVFVAANDGSTGTELYAFTAKQLGVSEAEAIGTSCMGTGQPDDRDLGRRAEPGQRRVQHHAGRRQAELALRAVPRVHARRRADRSVHDLPVARADGEPRRHVGRRRLRGHEPAGARERLRARRARVCAVGRARRRWPDPQPRELEQRAEAARRAELKAVARGAGRRQDAGP
jgi:ELWxxDGT repeat protein